MARHWLPLLALLLLPAAPHAAAQDVPAVGTPATFDVATWNIEHFGNDGSGPWNDEQQLEHVARVVTQAEIDLWAVQEIDDDDDFARLLTMLGDDFGGFLSRQGGSLFRGFLFRKATVRPRALKEILTDAGYAFASRAPLLLEADVTLPDTTLRVTFIALHMKCCGDTKSYERRQEAARRLKSELDLLYPNVPVVVLGDFNDQLRRSIAGGRTTPYDNFLQDPDHYRFLTSQIDQAGLNTWCGNTACTSGSTLDHILITDELVPAVVEGATARYTALLDALPGYVGTTSDHLPVYTRFAFHTGTAIEAPAAAAPGRPVAVFPNPFHGRATVRYTLERPGPVRLAVYDLLGRRVALPVDAFQAAGPHDVAFDAAGLPPGTYLLRLQADGVTTVRPVVHAAR